MDYGNVAVEVVQ